MTPKKPEPKKYPSGPSGKHNNPSMALRAPEAELEAASRAAERFGVTRNDLARAALRLASREAADLPRGTEKALCDELEDVSKDRKP